MKYRVREQIEINAPLEQVYAVAIDPAVVPLYVPEIRRVEILEQSANGDQLVRSHIKVAIFSIKYLYRYRYIQNKYYGGVQEKGRYLRGYFGLRFRRREDKTVVTHTEGVLSNIPGLAKLTGIIYFRILMRGSTKGELRRLKELAETRATIKN